MSRLGPRTSTILAPLAMGVGATSGVRLLGEAIGPSPVHLLGLLGGCALSLLAGRMAPLQGQRPSIRIGSLAAPWAYLFAVDLLLRSWGGMGLGSQGALWMICLGWSICLLPWARIYQSHGNSEAPWAAPMLALGAWAALETSPVAGILSSTGAFLLLELLSRPQPEVSGGLRWRSRRLPALALTVSSSIGLWLAVRACLDPTPSAAIIFGLMVMLAVPLGRAFAPRSDAQALLWSGCWALLCVALVRVVGRWSREFLLLSLGDAGPIPGKWALWSAPTCLGLLCGVWIGLSIGPRRHALPSRGRALGLVLGLLFLPLLQHEGLLGLCAGLAGGLAFLTAAARWTQAGGIVLAMAAALAPMFIPRFPVGDQSLEPDTEPGAWLVDLSQGQFRLLQNFDDLERDGAWRIGRSPASLQWGLRGTGSAWVESNAWDPLAPDPEIPGWTVTVEQEGLLSWSRGREAKAEYLAGVLGAALAPQSDHVLILGDPTGRALMGLKSTRPEDSGASVKFALPQSGPLSQVSRFDPGLAEALTPFDTVLHAHPEIVLRLQDELDILVEVIRSPWQDATSPSLTDTHLAAATSRLGDQGIFVAAVHLRWFDTGAPEDLAGRLSTHFDHVQIWLPPEGADSLVLVGSQTPLSLTQLGQRLPRDSSPLEVLGMPDAMALAAHVLGDHQSAQQWSTLGASQAPDRLGSRVFNAWPPHWHTLHLDAFKSSIAQAWSLDTTSKDLSTSDLSRLLIYRDTVELFLSNLVEEASGKPAASHLLSQALDRRDDPLAQKKLSELISHHLDLARARIIEAAATGDTDAWQEAQALAESAHRRAPGEQGPLLLLGEILIAQGQLSAAKQRYEAVLDLNSQSKQALWGLARVARQRHDYDGAEAQLREAVRFHPRDWTCWQQLGVFLLEQGRAEDAAEALSRSASMSEGNHPRPYLGLAQAQLDLDRADQALATANRAIHLKGGAYALYLRGRAYLDLEQLDRAEADFRAAILADPDLVEARGGLGLIRVQQKDYAAAAEAFRGILRVDPSNAAARENLLEAEERLRGGQTLDAP